MLNADSPLNPLMAKGRGDAREVMATAARIVRKAQDTKTADASATLSTSLQLVLTTALTDGYEPHEAYDALCGLLSWSIRRLESDDRIGVLQAIVSAVVGQMMVGDEAVPVSVN